MTVVRAVTGKSLTSVADLAKNIKLNRPMQHICKPKAFKRTALLLIHPFKIATFEF